MISLEAPEGIADINKISKPEKELFYAESVRLFSDVCKRCDIFNAKQLVDSYENLTIDQDEEYVLPLHWAALNNHLQLCQYLLMNGSFVNAKCNRDMSTALHWAASKGNCTIGLLLIEKGADF